MLDKADISMHGRHSLQSMIEIFAEPVETQLKDGDAREMPATISKDRTLSDYRHFNFWLFRASTSSVSPLKTAEEVCEKLLTSEELPGSFQDFVILAGIFLASPITSVSFERGFSTQNRVKKNLNQKLLISLHGL